MYGTPWELVPDSDSREIKTEAKMHVNAANVEDNMETVERREAARGMKTTKKDVDNFGITPGCPGCTAEGRNAAKAANHERL